MADNSNARRLFCILEILKKYSDANHRLSQQNIINYLWDLYEIKADRKTVKNNIMSLIEYGFEINYSEKLRNKGTPEENTVMSDYYMDKEFDDSELRLLIDSVLYSPNISVCQSKHLIEKLQNQSSKYFKAHTKHISCMPSNKSENKQLFHTIDVIDEAINNKKMISFKCVNYGWDMQLHVEKGKMGGDMNNGFPLWCVSPYQMVMSNGIYYLVCGHHKRRIVQISLNKLYDVEILEDDAYPIDKMPDAEELSVIYRMNSPYFEKKFLMMKDILIRARIHVPKKAFRIVPDAFGKEATIFNSQGLFFDFEVRAFESEILDFAMKYIGVVTVTEPEEVVNKIKGRLERGLEGYQNVPDV